MTTTSAFTRTFPRFQSFRTLERGDAGPARP